MQTSAKNFFPNLSSRLDFSPLYFYKSNLVFINLGAVLELMLCKTGWLIISTNRVRRKKCYWTIFCNCTALYCSNEYLSIQLLSCCRRQLVSFSKSAPSVSQLRPSRLFNLVMQKITYHLFLMPRKKEITTVDRRQAMELMSSATPQ